MSDIEPKRGEEGGGSFFQQHREGERWGLLWKGGDDELSQRFEPWVTLLVCSSASSNKWIAHEEEGSPIRLLLLLLLFRALDMSDFSFILRQRISMNQQGERALCLI